MSNMNIHMRGENAVPIIIAHRTVTREPTINRTRKFVGVRAGLKSLAARLLEVVHETFWEVENEVVDGGQSDVIHYAIQISDPPGADSPEIVVSRLEGGRPGCGAYFEVINILKQEEKIQPPKQPESKAKAVVERPRPQGRSQQ